jgi:hypothetical protein
MKAKPSPTIRRKAQKSGQTVGIVSSAACVICAGVACARIVDVAQQQEGKAQIGRMRLEGRAHGGVGGLALSRIVWSAS